MDMMSYLMGKNSGGGSKGVKIEVVTELPETGEANVIYLVPKQDEDENNVFNEYLYVNNEWELIGSTDIDIDGVEIKALRSVGGTNNNTKTNYYSISFSASGTPTIGSPLLKPAILDIMNDYAKHFDSNYSNNKIIIDVKTETNKTDCTFYIDNWGTSPITSRLNSYDIYPGYYTRSALTFTIVDNVYTDYTTSIVQNATTSNAYPLLKNNTYAYTPTGDYNPATKKYVDDAVAGAGGGSSKGLDTCIIEVEDNSFSSNWMKFIGEESVSSYSLSTTIKAKIASFLQEMYDKGNDNFCFLATNHNQYGKYSMLFYINKSQNTLSTKVTSLVFETAAQLNYSTAKTNFYKINISLQWNGDTISNVSNTYINKEAHDVSYTVMPGVYSLINVSLFDSNTTYNTGDYVYYSENVIYMATQDGVVGKYPNSHPEYWTQKTYIECLQDKIVGNALGGSY